jgi:hypothetical protein
MGLYAYVVIEGSRAVHQDLSTVDMGALRAVVREVDVADFEGDRLEMHLQDPAWLESAVRDHEQVIERFLGGGPVVPMQFGSIFSARDGLESMLAANAAQLETLLERVRGREEWGLKLRIDVAAAARDLVTAPAATGGRAYLERRRAEQQAEGRVAEHAAAVAEDVHRSLADVVDAAARLAIRASAGPGTLILNGAYLVPEGERTAFFARAEELQRDLGNAYRFDLTGPWPPYSFTSVDVAGTH